MIVHQEGNSHKEGSNYPQILFVATEILASGQVVSGSGKSHDDAISNFTRNHALALKGENLNESLRDF